MCGVALQRGPGGLLRRPGSRTLYLDGAAEELASFGHVEPVQIFSGEGETRYGPVLGRVQDHGDTAVGFADLHSQRGGEIDLPDGVLRYSLDGAHPSGLGHLQPVEGLAIHERAVSRDLE